MNETISIHIPIQIEHFADQFVRGRPLGPWKLQAIGKTIEEVLRQLQRQLSKALPTTLPTDLWAGSLPSHCDSWRSIVELPPPGRDTCWESTLQFELDCFRWQLDSGYCLVRVPAVSCNLFGKPEELNDAEVAKQARVALLRVAENQGLLALGQRFTRRTYQMHSLQLELPLGSLPDQDGHRKSERKKTAALRSTARELSSAKLPEIHGLDERAAELADHFLGERPQSVLLVGAAGVGKTSLLYRMVQLSQQLGLGHRSVWSTSGARIISGMSGLGMWQQRCAKLMRQAHATGAILHLGSLFELMEAGKVDGQPGVASMVRQSIARGKLLAVAECTPEQLALIERDDPMLLRAFTQMTFKEQSPAEIRQILRAAANHDWISERVDYSDQAIEELVQLYTRFATYSALPATALQLMRTITDRAEKETRIEADGVARAFASQTGLPQFLVDDAIPLDLAAISRDLSAQVIGQTEPVELIVDLIATLKTRMVRPGRPLASLMFIGPTGVGKTEMAKALAKLLYSDSSRMIRIDMSEYASPWSAVKLIGRPGEGDGALTSPIREQPFSVVLLDEFEKADPSFFDLLLQLLGEGRLTDSQGRLADFRNAVVIMTSNLGAETFRGGSFGFGDAESSNWREHFEREVRKFVRPELLGRLDRIVPFRPLTKTVVRQIAHRELDRLRERPGLKYRDVTLSVDDAAIDLLCELGYQPKYGARPLRREIERSVVVPLADELSRVTKDASCKFEVTQSEGKILVQTRKATPKSKSDREIEIDVIDAWQQLGRMARTARSSSPVRDLENEMERVARQNETLEKRLTVAQGTSRIAALRHQIQQGIALVEISRRIHQALLTTIERISRSHLSLMSEWHRGGQLDWSRWELLGREELNLLRQAIEDVVRRRVSGNDNLTLIISGRGEQALEALWKAYRQLADEHHWQFSAYGLVDVDPRRVVVNVENALASASRQRKPTTGEPRNYRLFGPAEPLVDAIPLDNAMNLANEQTSLWGLALQFKGAGVESWLEREAGIVHFHNSAVTGAKRRLRFRIIVIRGHLPETMLPLNWKDPLAVGDPDPRRTVELEQQIITSGTTQAMNGYAQGRLPEGLLANMQFEHEQALWQAIGYVAIPTPAKLDRYDDNNEVPF